MIAVKSTGILCAYVIREQPVFCRDRRETARTLYRHKKYPNRQQADRDSNQKAHTVRRHKKYQVVTQQI